MSYRDDNDAAYARADALQRDLDDAEAELVLTKRKLAASEHERADLAEKIAHAPPSSSPVHMAEEPVTPTTPPGSESRGFGKFVLCLVALVILTWLRVQVHNHR